MNYSLYHGSKFELNFSMHLVIGMAHEQASLFYILTNIFKNYLFLSVFSISFSSIAFSIH